MVVGGLALLVVVVVVVMMNSGGGASNAADSGSSAKPANTAPAAPAVAPKPAAAPTGTAKAGKTPERPAPALTADTLARASQLLEEAKALCNEGIQLRSNGDNQGARTKQTSAKDKIDVIKQMIDAPLRWQEEADLGGWAMPAEYDALAKLYGQLSTVENRVRKGGGT